MADSYQDWAVSDPSTTAYAFTKEWLRGSHVKVKHKPVGGTFTVLTTSQYAVTGSSGSATVTLDATAPTRAVGDTIRIYRETPVTKAERLVVFEDGSLDDTDLNTSALQLLFAIQEAQDELADTIQIASDDGLNWDAQSKRIKNLGAPTSASDAARLTDVQQVATEAGSLPGVTTNPDGSLLVVDSGGWEVQDKATARSSIGLGTAATADTGTSATNVPTITDADARYMKGSNNLSEVSNAATARTNLGLGSAAVLDDGVGAGELVALDGSARLPSVDGSLLDLTGHAVNQGRDDAFAEFELTANSVAPSAYAAVPLDAINGSFLNTEPDITVDTAGDDFTLVAGTYVINVKWLVENAAGSDAFFQWKLVRDPDGSPVDVYESPSVRISNASGGDMNQVAHVRDIVVVIASGTTYDFQWRDTAATSGVDIIEAQVSIRKVTV